MNVSKISTKSVSYVVFAYMVLAFGWWAYLLWARNDEMKGMHEALLEHQRLHHTEIKVMDASKIEKEWRKNQRMIVAEGLFFVGCLLFGLWIISKSAKHQVSLARQRRNFMLSITHELKSPIASVKLVLETLLKRDLSRENMDKVCTGALRDANRLQTLVEDLLLAARLENQWQPLQEPIALKSIIQDCASNLSLRFPHANIAISVPDQLPPFSFDKQGFISVVQNLVENAIKYSPEGESVQIKATQSNHRMLLEVSDHGHGIPDTEKKSVFEKFYRVGNEDTRKNTGTGLGLYIVKQVVLAHQGTIQILDNQPNGTIFKIELPL